MLSIFVFALFAAVYLMLVVGFVFFDMDTERFMTGIGGTSVIQSIAVVVGAYYFGKEKKPEES